MTLACEDAYSKLVVVVTVADVDAEDHVGNSLLIWELMLRRESEDELDQDLCFNL